VLFLRLSLGVPSWILVEKMSSWCDLIKSIRRSLWFFYLSNVFRFFPLVLPWDPILGPGGKSEVLKRHNKSQLKVDKVFLPVRHFPFCLFGCTSGSHPGSWWKKVRSWCDLLIFNKKSLWCFYLSGVFLFVPLTVTWEPILDPGGKSEVLIEPYKI
jgi:hypothetical protein